MSLAFRPRWFRSALAVTTLAVVAGASEARAALITYDFQGTIDSVDPALAGTFSIGQSLSGLYTFESTTAARAGSDSTFAVFDALTNLAFTLGTYSASSTGALEIQVDNDPPAPDSDRYAVVSRASDGLSGPSLGSFSLDFFGFRLDDSTNTVFSDALILPTSLDLADFDNRRFFLFFRDGSDFVGVSGTIDSLSAVPEPSSLALGLVGVATGAGVAWRRRRRSDA